MMMIANERNNTHSHRVFWSDTQKRLGRVGVGGGGGDLAGGKTERNGEQAKSGSGALEMWRSKSLWFKRRDVG